MLSATAIVAIYTYLQRYPIARWLVIVFGTMVLFLIIGLILEKMIEYFEKVNFVKELQKKVLKVSGVQNVTISTGRSFLSGTGSNYGLAFVKLKPFDERGKGEAADELTKKLFGIASSIPDAKIIFFQPFVLLLSQYLLKIAPLLQVFSLKAIQAVHSTYLVLITKKFLFSYTNFFMVISLA